MCARAQSAIRLGPGVRGRMRQARVHLCSFLRHFLPLRVLLRRCASLCMTSCAPLSGGGQGSWAQRDRCRVAARASPRKLTVAGRGQGAAIGFVITSAGCSREVDLTATAARCTGSAVRKAQFWRPPWHGAAIVSRELSLLKRREVRHANKASSDWCNGRRGKVPAPACEDGFAVTLLGGWRSSGPRRGCRREHCEGLPAEPRGGRPRRHRRGEWRRFVWASSQEHGAARQTRGTSKRERWSADVSRHDLDTFIFSGRRFFRKFGIQHDQSDACQRSRGGWAKMPTLTRGRPPMNLMMRPFEASRGSRPSSPGADTVKCCQIGARWRARGDVQRPRVGLAGHSHARYAGSLGLGLWARPMWMLASARTLHFPRVGCGVSGTGVRRCEVAELGQFFDS